MEEKKPRFKNPILLGNFGLFSVRSCYYIREAMKNYVSQDTKWYITSWRAE